MRPPPDKRFYLRFLLKVAILLLVSLFLMYRYNSRLEQAKNEERAKVFSMQNTFSTASDWGERFLRSNGYVIADGEPGVAEFNRFFDENVDDDIHRPRTGGLLAANTETKILALGAFWGDHAIRRHGGFWRLNGVREDTVDDASVVLSDGERIWPLRQVRTRVAAGAAHRFK